MTRQREAVMQTVLSSPRHMTADEVFEAAQARLPGISRATVYRNLGLMERDGQVRRVRMACASDRFDRVLAPHDHIRCPPLRGIAGCDARRSSGTSGGKARPAGRNL